LSATDRIEPYDKRRHAVKTFDCGEPSLDRWLIQYAGQGQRRRTARTFVALDADSQVTGYYTLVGSIATHESATAAVSRGTSSFYDIPVCLLARLAVDRRHQGRKLGATLMLDAFARALTGADNLGLRAIVVDAINEQAASFYRHFAFEPLPDEPLTLMVPLATVERLLDATP
jgi:GNAT superfamily N-acetyltransferase